MTTKNTVLTTLLLFFITLEVLIAADYVAKHQDLRNKRLAIYSGLMALQSQLGYGGFIHNFKNYILQPEEARYQEQASENYQKAIKHIAEIEDLGNTFIAKLGMPHTKAMLAAYKNQLDSLPELLKRDLTANEIDTLVRYNDEPANLEIKNVSNLITSQLESQITQILTRSLILGGLVLLGLLISLVAVIRYFFKEQHELLLLRTQQNTEMQQHKTDMQRSQSILISVMQDVEKEKRHTSALNKQLEIKNKEMEQFIYTVSHDLKSPLVTINGFTRKLLEELEQNITEKQVYRLNRIIENVKNMESLLTDLLDISRIAQKDISTTEIDVKSMIDKQIKSLEQSINDTQTSIRCAESLHKVVAHPRLFSEALLNLMTNAIRYREPTRPLIITISTTRTANATTIHVKDNGIGIAPKYHELIFNIFERLSTNQGTGVGLTIVKTIMEKHNGEVSLASTENEGSCFSLTFPDYPHTKTDN